MQPPWPMHGEHSPSAQLKTYCLRLAKGDSKKHTTLFRCRKAAHFNELITALLPQDAGI